MRDQGENGDCKLRNYRNSGIRRYGIHFIEGAKVRPAMKNLKRLVLGALSSLLFTVGFARVADQLDPMSESLSANDTAVSSSPDCTSLCDIHDDKA